MALAVFDVDDTLLQGDCSTLWIDYMVEQGLVDGDEMRAKEAILMEDYYRGALDIAEYSRLLLAPLVGMTRERVDAMADDYTQRYVMQIVRQRAVEQLAWHRQQGDRLMIISASFDFLVEAIARQLNVEEVIGIEVLLDDAKMTDQIAEVVSYQEGKLILLQAWLSQRGETLSGSYFYSDSHNDLPLLEAVENPVTVTPCDVLKETATARGWPQLDWHQSVSPA